MTTTNDKANLGRYIYCVRCSGLLTSADDERGACTQCRAQLPPLRQLLVKIANYDRLPAQARVGAGYSVDVRLTAADVRLAKELVSD